MDSATRAAYASRRIGRSQAPGQSPCLVVVDLTYGFTDPALPLGCDAATALRATAELLDAARAMGLPRVFTKVEYEPGDLAVAAAFIEKMPALATLTPGSHASTIDAAVAPLPDEPVLRKLFASAFYGTPLSSLLAATGCDSVIITGASTSGCVRATAVDALQHGYRVVVPADATADRAVAPHEAALFDIAAKYGEVVTTTEVLALLRSLPSPAELPV